MPAPVLFAAMRHPKGPDAMTPAARLQAVIDLLTEIDETPRPADAVMSAYFRNRRYIGSKDRTAIA